jgi:chromosome segregation ATPase
MMSGGAFARTSVGLSGVANIDLTKLIKFLVSSTDLSSLVKAVTNAIGIADTKSLAALQHELLGVLDELGRMREREIAMAGGLSQIRTRAARFDEAIGGLARVQGRLVARLDEQAERAQEVELMAGRRDDHITRLIRDHAAQRAELERLSRRSAEADKQAASWQKRLDLAEADSFDDERMARLEDGVDDLKRAQKNGIQGAIESLDGLRERVGRLEARSAEMTRESRAKTGRLDALARHVASVEGRLTTAIGKGGGNVVTVAARKIEDFEKTEAGSQQATSP